MSLTYAPRRSVYLIYDLAAYDFLTPSFIHTSRTPRTFRNLTTSQKFRADAAFHDAQKPSIDRASSVSAPKEPLTQAHRDYLTSALRVNQAGELAACVIYTAQMPPIVNSHPHLRPLMRHMYNQEAGHFQTFNLLLAKHRVRPTAMYPVWTLAASVLGWGTAILGREAAMACTEAVETAIGGHYNEQVGGLLEMAEEMEKKGQDIGEELRGLTSTIRRIRDEELEHLDHAVENDAKQAKPYEMLTGVIKAGCRGAIWVSERV